MIKPITLAVLCALTLPAEAQTLGDTVVSQFAEFKKAKAAVRICLSEEGQMQIERNQHYDARLHADAKDPAAPTIDEMYQAQARVRPEDDALEQKRDECTPLFDELLVEAAELRRDCFNYAPPSTSDEPLPEMDSLAKNICQPPAKTTEASKPANP